MKRLILAIALLPALAQASDYTEESLRAVLTSEVERCPNIMAPVPRGTKDVTGYVNNMLACHKRNRLRHETEFMKEFGHAYLTNSLFPAVSRKQFESFLAGGPLECNYPSKNCATHFGEDREYNHTPSHVEVRTESYGGGVGYSSTVTINGETVGTTVSGPGGVTSTYSGQ
jgi:hypothetical protein